MEYYNYIKALHLIFVITWFAGLFYMPRLFVYHIEASHKPEPDRSILSTQLKLMSRRLWYIITWPSAVLATFFAAWLLWLMPQWLSQQWMLIKLVFVALLVAYHLKTHLIFIAFSKDQIRYSSSAMRLWNEGATLILFAIIFLVMLRNSMGWVFGVLGLVGLSVLLLLGIRFYKRVRNKK